MAGIGRSCIVCGRRTTGATRCPEHAGQAGRRPRPCIVCGRPGPGNYCEAHNPQQGDRERRQPWRQAYRDPNYHRERQAALRRAGNGDAKRARCEDCGRPQGTPCGQHNTDRLQCDHVIELRRGGRNTRDNMRIRCCCCHAAKTAAAR